MLKFRINFRDQVPTKKDLKVVCSVKVSTVIVMFTFFLMIFFSYFMAGIQAQCYAKYLLSQLRQSCLDCDLSE